MATNDSRKRPFILRWRSAVLNSGEDPSVKLTLLTLAEYASADGNQCFPGMESLAELTSQSDRTCSRALKATAGTWFDRMEVNTGGKSWKGYSYTLRLPEGADTVSARSRKGADTVSAPCEPRSGQSVPMVLTSATHGPDTVSDELGRATRKSNKEGKRTFAQWHDAKAEGECLIPTDHHVFRYAEKIGLPVGFMELAWRTFCDRYRDNTRAKYSDWPAHFRKAVELNWYRLWFEADDGSYQLTQAGKQAQRYAEAA